MRRTEVMTRTLVLIGLLFSVSLGVFTFVAPENYRTLTTPIGVFMFGAAVVLYSPALTNLFRPVQIFGSTLLGAAVVLLCSGLMIPSARTLFLRVCAPGSSCWFATNALVVTTFTFAMVLLLLAPIVPARNGYVLPWARVGWASAVGAILAIAVVWAA